MAEKCSSCGAELPPDATGAQCGTCLLNLAATADRPSVAPDVTVKMSPAEILKFASPFPSAVTEKAGDAIGHYKLLQQIGEGGMGSVWMAEQDQPIRRRIALKVIKLGMDTREVVARFEAERQALAMMDHPNIAKILDAGATNSGRPYFVMELVQGIKITEYCDENNLTTEERLNLFVKICQAIQHAHQKGIIHRDIKPSNILVAMIDGAAVPKVIDFGIAKATTDQKLTDKTVFTAFEQFIGTPAYMSPEQANLNSLDIDARSDIYSLGVLLYEILTSKTPFETKELLVAGIDAMRRIIREEDPPRPSTRLSKLRQDELTTTAKHRRADAPTLMHLIRGDLDWIVMKTLEKDRARRYDSVSSLAADIQRHLAMQPVSAGPPSIVYRSGKFIRRNKVALSLTTLIVMLAVALLVSTTLLLREFHDSRYAGITINSNPEGAEVWHEGRHIGVTPFTAANLPVGMFAYHLTMTNYETVSNQTIMLAGKEMNDFTFLRKIELAEAGVPSLPAAGVKEFSVAAASGATVLTQEGIVEYEKMGATGWVVAPTNLVVGVGDRIRTGKRSRAVLRLSDHSVIRVSELTLLEIQAKPNGTKNRPALQLKNGRLFFPNTNGSTNSPEIKTPNATGSVRG